MLLSEYKGKLPCNTDALLKLPGIGRYTAGAIASIAFALDEPALDGNIKRVYTRLFDISAPVDSPNGEKGLWKIAKDNLPKGQAGNFNQALMDLGAMICVPKRPRCLICPLLKICKARRNGTEEQRPVKSPKKEIPLRIHAAGVVIKKGRVLLVRRPSTGLLGGMWEFPNGRVSGNPQKELTKALKDGYSLKVRVKEAMNVVQHTYTHFHLTAHVFRCELLSESKNENLTWVSLKALTEYPMGKVDRQIANTVVR